MQMWGIQSAVSLIKIKLTCLQQRVQSGLNPSSSHFWVSLVHRMFLRLSCTLDAWAKQQGNCRNVCMHGVRDYIQVSMHVGG